MASTTFTARSWYDFEFQRRSGSTTVGDGLYVAGSTIRFMNGPLSDTSITFSGRTSSLWDDPATFTLAPNTWVDKTIKATATLGSSYVFCNAAGKLFSGSFQIIAGVDSTPDPFSLGPDQSGLEPNVAVPLRTVTVGGVSGTNVQAVASNMEFLASSDTTNNWRTSFSVSNGTRLYCRTTAPSANDVSKVCRLTISSVFDEVTVSTTSEPNQGTYVPFPKTTGMSVSLNEVIQFFGGNAGFNPPRNMLAYFKGSAFVPNIPQNSDALLSPPFKLTDFLNSGTTFYFVRAPAGDSASADTTSASQSIGLRWTANGTRGWVIGYSPSMTNNTQYRFEVTALESIDGVGQFDLPTITPSTYASWSVSNTFINVAATASQNTENNYRGRIKIFARSSYDNAIEVSHEFNYSLNFYGP